LGEFWLRATDLLNPDLHMRRITSLSILFAALIEFAIERARFDLWIVAVVAIVALLWNVAGRTLHPDVSSKKHDHNTFTIQGVVCNFR
jgi:apolipoprotein N-acyltransferase